MSIAGAIETCAPASATHFQYLFVTCEKCQNERFREPEGVRAPNARHHHVPERSESGDDDECVTRPDGGEDRYDDDENLQWPGDVAGRERRLAQ